MEAEIEQTIEYSTTLNLSNLIVASFKANPQQQTQIVNYVQIFQDAANGLTPDQDRNINPADIELAQTQATYHLVSSAFGSDIQLPSLPTAPANSVYDDVSYFYELKESNSKLSSQAELARQAAVQIISQTFPVPQMTPLLEEIVGNMLSTATGLLADQLIKRLPLDELIAYAVNVGDIVKQAINANPDLVNQMYNPPSAQAPDKATLNALIQTNARDLANLDIADELELQRLEREQEQQKELEEIEQHTDKIDMAR